MTLLKRIYRKLKYFAIKRRNKNKLKQRIIRQNGQVNIVIGAAATGYNNWISTNINELNILKEKDWKFYFSKKGPNHLLAEHVFEHLTYKETEKALGYIFKYLENKGSLRIAVPDGYNISEEYREAVGPGGWDIGADDHKTFWNINTLASIADNVGFKVNKLEYYNNDRKFIMSDYTDDNGFVFRSFKHNYVDKNVPNYSSLIVDLIKYVE